jgi:hypothetical protein
VASDIFRARVRARYLDTAVRHFGLSLGLREVAEFSEGNPGEDGDRPAPDSLPDGCLSGSDATLLFVSAQIVLCELWGLEPPGPEDDYLDIPGVGVAAVRVALGPDRKLTTPFWLIEAQNLDPVPAHFLLGVDPAGLTEFVFLGWATRDEILRAETRPLVRGGPDVHRVPLDSLNPREE